MFALDENKNEVDSNLRMKTRSIASSLYEESSSLAQSNCDGKIAEAGVGHFR